MFGVRTEKQSKFEQVPEPEDCERLLADSERSSIDSSPSKPVSQGPSWLVTAVTVFLTAVLSAVFGAYTSQLVRLDADAFSIRHISQYCTLQSEGKHR